MHTRRLGASLVSTQTTYKSKDGTEVPIFLLHQKDVKLDGSAPTILYGYGGFRVGIYIKFCCCCRVTAMNSPTHNGQMTNLFTKMRIG